MTAGVSIVPKPPTETTSSPHLPEARKLESFSKPTNSDTPLGAPRIADTHNGRRTLEATSYGLWYYRMPDANVEKEPENTNTTVFLPALTFSTRRRGEKVPRFRLPSEDIDNKEIRVLKPGIKAALAIELLTNPAPLMVVVHELLNQPEGIKTYNSRTVRTQTQDKEIPPRFNIAISIMGPAHTGKSSIATLLNRQHDVPIVPLDRSRVALQYAGQEAPPFIEDLDKKRKRAAANYKLAAIAHKLDEIAIHKDSPFVVLDTSGFVIKSRTQDPSDKPTISRPDNPLAALARSGDIIALATESASSELVEGEPPRLFLDTPEGRRRIDEILKQNPGLAIPVTTRQCLPIFTSGDLRKSAERFMQILEEKEEIIQRWQFTRRLEWALLLVESIKTTGLKNALRRKIKQFIDESPHKLDSIEKQEFLLAFHSFFV